VVDSLKVLDPNRPIREADIKLGLRSAQQLRQLGDVRRDPPRHIVWVRTIAAAPRTDYCVIRAP